MRCIRVDVPGEPLKLHNEPIPEAPDTGAVVKVSYCGMCHSDVHFWEGGYALSNGQTMRFEGRPGFKYPCAPGHEICGTVFSLGKSATSDSAKLGDQVVVYPWIYCNSCRACRTGYNNSCDCEDVPPVYLGLTQDGGFADYVVVPDVRYLVTFPMSIPLPIASQLPCSGLTAFNAVDEGVEFVKSTMEIKGNCCVVVFGAGGLGQWGVRFARALYPPETQIICADIKQDSLDAVTSDVKDVVPILTRNQTTEETVQRVKTTSVSGKGVDLVLDFVGLTPTFSVAKSSLLVLGRYHVVGLLGGQANFPLPDMVLNGITMRGLAIGSFVQFRKLLKLLEKEPSVCTGLPYSVHPLAEAQEVMQQLVHGKVTGRAVLRCGED
ncbi:alcohol dehydrogenase-like [Asterias rubens]|uniref:alcohol dehydrogenase-like n=1 Tax=Asterias rubens TaxID=7604 RepID=UPI0014551199|nr:alcohol dehydrogenase-like [Asterias rubens]